VREVPKNGEFNLSVVVPFPHFQCGRQTIFHNKKTGLIDFPVVWWWLWICESH